MTEIINTLNHLIDTAGALLAKEPQIPLINDLRTTLTSQRFAGKPSMLAQSMTTSERCAWSANSGRFCRRPLPITISAASTFK